MKEPNLSNIIEMLEGARGPNPSPIPFDKLDYWILHDDMDLLEITGAIIHYLDYSEVSKSIIPPISPEWYAKIFLKYTELCIKKDINGEWRDSRYEAGWNFAAWFISLWRDKDKFIYLIDTSKSFICNLYREGGSDIRVCIVNSILEHLFSDRSVVEFFSDWRDDPVLKEGYSEALLWDGEYPLST